jgi:hypothetical protein
MADWINRVLRDKSTITTDRQSAMRFIIPITDMVFKLYADVVPMIERIKSVSNIKLSDSMSDDDARLLIIDAFKKLGIRDNSIEYRINRIRRDYDDDGNELAENSSLIRELKLYMVSVNKIFRLFYKLFSTTKQLGIRIFTQLCTSESSEKAAVFLRIKPPQHLIEKLRELWGYSKFQYKEVILTKMDRAYINKRHFTQGNILSNITPQTVWINISLFSNKTKFAELVDVDVRYVRHNSAVPHVYPMPTKYTAAFIETLVHESRHIMQYVTNSSVINEDNNSTEYVKRLKEIDARRLAHEYVTKHMTKEDTDWAKKVISQAIAQELKHVKQYRPDAKSK